MSESMVVELPDGLKARIAELSGAEGVTAEDWVARAIQARVFTQAFRATREEILQILDDRGVHLTDEDVFKMVS
ncbi:MAG: hypothetical protein JO306_06765 [Gemmatimonadetes bacterium]|nr:hypothetical protein [Gemmatimonadota bacterium]